MGTFSAYPKPLVLRRPKWKHGILLEGETESTNNANSNPEPQKVILRRNQNAVGFIRTGADSFLYTVRQERSSSPRGKLLSPLIRDRLGKSEAGHPGAVFSLKALGEKIRNNYTRGGEGSLLLESAGGGAGNPSGVRRKDWGSTYGRIFVVPQIIVVLEEERSAERSGAG